MSDTLLTLLQAPERSSASPAPGKTLASQLGTPLRPGTRLGAQVLATSTSGQATLKLGEHTIQVRTTIPLQVGEQLNLQVTHAGRLLVLARRDDATALPRTIPQVATALLRQQLPTQRSLTELLGSLSVLARSSSSSSPVPRELSAAASALLAALSKRAELGAADGLARAVRQGVDGKMAKLSEVLGEELARLPLLAQGRAGGLSPSGQEADRLLPLPGQRPVPQGRAKGSAEVPSSRALRQQLQGVSARADLLAMSAMFPRRQERAALAVEIPVLAPGEQQADVVALRIAQEAIGPIQDYHERSGGSQRGGAGEAEHRWRVELAFDLPGLGALEAVVTLSEQSRVAVSFRARESETSAQVQGKLEHLGQRLLAQGLEVDGLLVGSDPGDAPPLGTMGDYPPMVSERA